MCSDILILTCPLRLHGVSLFLCLTSINRFRPNHDSITNSFPFSLAAKVLLLLTITYFDVLLTVHLSIILGIDQLNAQILVL